MKQILSILLISTLLPALFVLADDYEDDFDDEMNYLDGLESSIWDGLDAFGASSILQCNTISNDGNLTIGTASTDNDNMVMLYMNISPDFDFDAQVTFTGGQYASWEGDMTWVSAGLVARKNSSNWVYNIGFDHSEWVATYMFRSYTDGAETQITTGCEDGNIIDYPYTRLERIGSDYIASYSENGSSWTIIGTNTRPDFDGHPLKVGISHGMYSDLDGPVMFDDFYIDVVPEPATPLILAGCLVLAWFRR